MSQLIALTVTKRAGKTVAPVFAATAFDIDDIVSPIRFNAADSVSYFRTKLMKGTSDGRAYGSFFVEYEVSNTLANINAQSFNLIALTVTKRNNTTYTTPETVVFNAKRVAETITVLSALGGSKFLYAEPGDPHAVAYEVTEDPVTIAAMTTITTGVGGGGTARYIAMWLNPTTLGDSIIYQDITGFLGIGTITPSADIDLIKSASGGDVTVRVVNSNADPNSNAKIQIRVEDGGDPVLFFTSQTVMENWYMGLDTSDGAKFKIGADPAAPIPGTNDIVTIKLTGETGFGTTDPLATVHAFGGTTTQRLETTTGSQEDTIGDTVNTTNATVTTILTIPIPADSGLQIRTNINCRKTAGAGSGTVGDTNSYTRTVKAKNVGGVVTIGSIEVDFTSEDIATFDVNYVVSGTNVLVQVTGSINNDVTWNAIANTYNV